MKQKQKNRFAQLLSELQRTGTGRMHISGDSMRPIIESGAMLTYQVAYEYKVGDIVFVRLPGGKFIDAHRILKKSEEGDRFLIGSDVGSVNGWVQKQSIFAKVIEIQQPDTKHVVELGRAERKGDIKHGK